MYEYITIKIPAEKFHLNSDEETKALAEKGWRLIKVTEPSVPRQSYITLFGIPILGIKTVETSKDGGQYILLFERALG